jgi:hypothetical protein
MLYFAYGSNMSFRRLRQRAASARRVTVATLLGHELRFHKVGQDGSGKCDAYETGDERDAVIGVVFDIDDPDKSMLDAAEGLGHGYGEKNVGLLTPADKRLEALTYYALAVDPVLRPFDWYKQHVLNGAAEAGLPGEYIQYAIHGVESISDHDRMRHASELAIYL